MMAELVGADSTAVESSLEPRLSRLESMRGYGPAVNEREQLVPASAERALIFAPPGLKLGGTSIAARFSS
jgi:hypothetical protein